MIPDHQKLGYFTYGIEEKQFYLFLIFLTLKIKMK